MVYMIAADMDLHVLKKKLTANKDEAFDAWVYACTGRLKYKEPCYKEAWEKAEARCSDFFFTRQLGPASAHTPGGEHAQAGLL